MIEAKYPSLHGVPVLVTGGGSGIGASVVAHFCAQGSRVGFIEIDEAAAERTAQSIELAARPTYEICDLRDIDAMKAAIERLQGALGIFRVLVNNAGNDDRHEVAEVTPDYWDDRFALNLRHQFFAAQTMAKGMADEGGGSIINLGSVSWMMGAARVIAYATAKSAVSGFTKSLARELGTAHIRVNAIAPGWVLTPKQVERARATAPEKFAQFLERQCIKEHLAPADIARLALWLAADDSRLCTGQTFILDAGVV